MFQELSYFPFTKYRFSLVNKILIQLEPYIINIMSDLMRDLALKRSCDDIYVSYTKTTDWFLEGHFSKNYGYEISVKSSTNNYVT